MSERHDSTELELPSLATDARPVGPARRAPGAAAGRSGRRRASRVLALLALAGLAAAAVWAYQANTRAGHGRMDMSMRYTGSGSAFPVVLAAPERQAMAGTVTYTGSVAPFSEEDIFPRVTGRIVDMPVYPGDAVRAGQVVARLDDVELGSRVREAEAMRGTALANRAQMEADVNAARHGVIQMERELAMAEADAGYAAGVSARTEKLFASGAVSRQERENDRTVAVAAEAKRDAARHRLEQAQAMEAAAQRKVDAAHAMVAQSEAQLGTARIVRDYVAITAPSSGYVVKRLVPPGVLVQPGMPILKMAQVDRVRLQANVGEKDLGSIRVGSPVTVVTAAAGAAPFTARVSSVFPFVDQGSRTAVVEAVVDNPGRRLLPGQYVTMQFVTGQSPRALTVPQGAVTRMSGKAWLWVAVEGKAERREVVTGIENPQRVEIVKGLAGGERVITRAPDGIYPGARVSAADAAPAGARGDESLEGSQGKPAAQVPAATGGGHAGH